MKKEEAKQKYVADFFSLGSVAINEEKHKLTLVALNCLHCFVATIVFR